jgi:predicted RNA-binding Zn-ribbon protein involved in translation (DUF1610 family)
MQVQCPSCNTVVTHPDSRAGQVVNCPKCGAQMQLPAAAGPAAPAAAAPGGQTKRCPYCGESILADAQKCRHCGEYLDASRRQVSAEGNRALEAYQKGMRILSTVLYIFGFLALLGGGCMMVGAGAAGRSSPEVAGFLGLMVVVVLVIGAIYVAMGYFARKFYPWVNWVVAILSGLSLLGNIVNLASQGAKNILGVIITGALLALAISNLVKLNAVRAAGMNPTDVPNPLK